MATTSLMTLPQELLAQIVDQYYTPWSLYILDRSGNSSLPIDGLHTNQLLLINKTFHKLAIRAERASFTGALIFTTSSTQWRLLKRLRSLSTRLAQTLDKATHLVFCSPPLFTNRVPWSTLPNLERIELDYCYRSANFRCQGSLAELEGGYLDPMIVNFARDTERFDGPLVEDAWRPKGQVATTIYQNYQPENDRTPCDEPEPLSSEPASTNDANPNTSGGQVEVQVIKRMTVFESSISTFHNESAERRTAIQQGELISERWDIKVIATHRGEIVDVRYIIIDGDHVIPDIETETVVWTPAMGFRETIPFEDIPKRILKLKGNEEREKYLVDK